MLTALIVFLPLTIGLLLLELRLQAATAGSELQAWLADHLYLPLVRAIALLAFIFIAHPELFGLTQAPSLGTLLGAGHYRFDQLINLFLIVSLLLPLLPLLNRIAGVTLALQGFCATALLASWLAAEAGAALAFIPGPGQFLRIIAVLLAARLLAEWLAKELAKTTAWRDLLVEAARMAAQLPAVIIYARFLGRQLAG